MRFCGLLRQPELSYFRIKVSLNYILQTSKLFHEKKKQQIKKLMKWHSDMTCWILALNDDSWFWILISSLVAILIMHVFAHFITFFCVMLWNVIDCVITKRSLRDKRLLEIIGYALVNLTKNWSEVFESMILPWQTPMVVQGVLALCEILYCEFFHCSFSKLLL